MTWNRRDFVKASALATMASAIPQTGRRAATRCRSSPAPAIFTPLRRNVGIFNQRGGTIGWLINGDGVLVVDSQFADTAPNLLAGLKERSPRQIDVLDQQPSPSGSHRRQRRAAQREADRRARAVARESARAG